MWAKFSFSGRWTPALGALQWGSSPALRTWELGTFWPSHIHLGVATGNRICKCCKTWSSSKFISPHKTNLLISSRDYKSIIITTQYFPLQNTKREESWWRALIFPGLAAELLNVTGQQHCCKMGANNTQLYLDKNKQKTKPPHPLNDKAKPSAEISSHFLAQHTLPKH